MYYTKNKKNKAGRRRTRLQNNIHILPPFYQDGQRGQTMNTYQRRKEQARQKAIAWQNDFGSKAHTGWDLVDAYAYFAKLGKRYGLTREFAENGII